MFVVANSNTIEIGQLDDCGIPLPPDELSA
jgi:hypothetical protein